MVRKWVVILASMALVAFVLVVVASMPRPAVASDTLPGDVVPAIDLVQLEQDFVKREAAYREQIVELESLRQQRRAIYEEQVKTLTDALALGRSRLEKLTAQEAAVRQQLVQLDAARAERQAVLMARRQEAANLYDGRYNQMMAQLAETQAKLAEAQQILGQ